MLVNIQALAFFYNEQTDSHTLERQSEGEPQVQEFR